MSYAIIGFGNIGRALAKAFARNGVEVFVATTRDPESFASDAAAIGPSIIPRTLAEDTRIAKGSGQPETQVQELVQKFLFMKQMMEGLGSNMGMLGRVPGMKGVAMAKQMRKQMAQGGGMPGMGFPGMMGMGGLPECPGWECPGWECPGWECLPGMGPGGGESLTKMRAMSASEKNAKKAQRKREKDARRKGRR